MTTLDTSKMSKGKAEAMEIAEASRQEALAGETLSLGMELFMGRLRAQRLWPYPAQSDADRREGDALLLRLEAFLRAHVDAERIDREQELPAELVRGLAELGLFGMKIPKQYGGLGLSQVNYNRAIALVASHCGSTAVWLSAHQSIGVPQPLKLFGTEEQKKKWLPEFSRGAISAFALTEPEVGSDPAKMTTTATPTQDEKHFILNGEKLWCTNGLVARYIVVMARTPDLSINGKQRKQITAFVVDTQEPGFEIVHRCRFLGIRAIQNGLLRFHNMKVPRENILLGEGQGLKLALITLNTGRLTLPAAASGAAKRGLAMARRWAAHRVQWGGPIAEHDAIAQKLAGMAATTFAMEAMTWYASALADRGQADIRLEAAMAKLFCSEAAWHIMDDTLQIRGGRGYETEKSLRERGEVAYPVERMLRDSRINTIIEGSSEIMRLFIAREALDPHLKAAGALVNPKAAKNQAALWVAAGKAGLFYARWYPARWLPWGLEPAFAAFGPLARHLRWAAASANKLARNIFHLMLWHGPALERRQSVLGRMVDIGVELFACATACSYARHLAEKEGKPEAEELADHFCRLSRRKTSRLFKDLWCHEDKSGAHLAQRLSRGCFAWLEQGAMPVEEFK